MRSRSTQEALEHIRSEAGDNGLVLAQTLIKVFGGIGRGVDDRRVVLHLADAVQVGSIRMRERVFVYEDTRGRDMVFGAQGDIVINEVVFIAGNLHREVAKKRGFQPVDDDEVRSGILSAARQVSYELERRHRVQKIKNWVRSIIRV